MSPEQVADDWLIRDLYSAANLDPPALWQLEVLRKVYKGVGMRLAEASMANYLDTL